MVFPSGGDRDFSRPPVSVDAQSQVPPKDPELQPHPDSQPPHLLSFAGSMRPGNYLLSYYVRQFQHRMPNKVRFSLASAARLREDRRDTSEHPWLRWLAAGTFGGTGVARDGLSDLQSKQGRCPPRPDAHIPRLLIRTCSFERWPVFPGRERLLFEGERSGDA